jgi:hypothetical protein
VAYETKTIEQYENMSDEELEASNRALSDTRVALHDEQLKIKQVRDGRYSLASAKAKLDSLTPEEKAALAKEQIITIPGIASAESVNGETK